MASTRTRGHRLASSDVAPAVHLSRLAFTNVEGSRDEANPTFAGPQEVGLGSSLYRYFTAISGTMRCLNACS